jgi:toxin CptA
VLNLLDGRLWSAKRARGQPTIRSATSAPVSLALALVFVLALPLLWFSLVASPALTIDVGAWGDHTVLTGVNAIESSSTETYRWTTARATVSLPNLSSRYQMLRMRAHGWRPAGAAAPTVQLDVAGHPWGQLSAPPEMRLYSILLPRDYVSPSIAVGLTSQVYRAPDRRQLGIALDWIEARAFGAASGPAPWQIGGQALLLALLLALLWALALPAGWALGLAGLLCGALVWANVRQPLWVGQALGPWLLLAVLLLAAAWSLAPWLARALSPWMSPRQARVAWALFLAALALRLAGAIHPLFDAHDLTVHTSWLDTVNSGQLYLYSTPGEFHGQRTFNPPAGYLLLLPLELLLPDSRLAVQAGVALLDALGCLLLLPLARALRLPGRAALFALALYLALPINMTMLWWGFATNAIAQTLWLLLLWALLLVVRRPSRGAAAIFAVASAVALLTHVGALALAAAMLGLTVALGWRRLPAQSRAALFAGLLAVALLATAIYFSAALGPVVGQRNPDSLDLGRAFAKSWAARELKIGFISRGLLLGFLPPTLALAPVGLALLLGARGRHPLMRVLVAAWLAVCLVFLAADLGLGLLVRYVYFAAPLICLGAGALLAALHRRAAGRVAAAALVVFVAWSGATLWAAAVLDRVKPSVLPLTH